MGFTTTVSVCPGADRNAHNMDALAYRDEQVNHATSNTASQIPMRIVFCSGCGYVFSVAPPKSLS